MSAPDLPDPSDRLDSWKEIAAFLARTVRTVQRWEKTAGLPVRRGGPGRGSVVASKAEITEWWRSRKTLLGDDNDNEEVATAVQPARLHPVPSGARTGLTIAGTIAVAAVALIALYGRRPDPGATAPQPPARIGRLLAAATSEGAAPLLVPIGGQLSDLVVAPDDRVLYVAADDRGFVAVLDATTLETLRTIPTVERGWTLELSPDGKRLYVGGVRELAIIDLERDNVVRIPLGRMVQDLQLSADGRRLWIALAQGGLKVLDTTTHESALTPTIGCPMRLALDARANRLYVSYQCGGPGGRPGYDAIEVLDSASGESLTSHSSRPMVGGPMVLSPDGAHLWVDASDACHSPEYDHAGCPPGSGSVLHAFRALTLEPVLSARLPDRTAGTRPTFVPDGSRLVAASLGIYVVNASIGQTVEAWSETPAGKALFSRDGSRWFVGLKDKSAIAAIPIDSASDAHDLGGLTSHWTGDGTANDTVGGTHAVAERGIGYAHGRRGQAFRFDGTTSEISLGRRFDGSPTDGPMSIAAWIQTDRVGAMTLMSRVSRIGWQWSLTQEGRPAFCFESGLPGLLCETSGQTAVPVDRQALVPHTWNHVAVVRTHDRLLLYQNGRLDAEASLEGYRPPPPPDDPRLQTTRIGTDPEGRARFSGLIDEVTLFNRALSAAEIAELMKLTTFQKR
jgi:hypothetical protein